MPLKLDKSRMLNFYKTIPWFIFFKEEENKSRDNNQMQCVDLVWVMSDKPTKKKERERDRQTDRHTYNLENLNIDIKELFIFRYDNIIMIMLYKSVLNL